jgi:hypothetical protein
MISRAVPPPASATLSAPTALAPGRVAMLSVTSFAATSTWISVEPPAARTFVRRGVAAFPNGDLAAARLEGSSMASDGRTMTYDVKLTYTFEDGSTIVQQGKGKTTGNPGKYADQSGAGAFVGGTGRFAGITGQTTSVGKGLSSMDAWGEFKAEYTIAK